MFKSYLKTAIRSLVISRSFSLINIFGLSVGVAMTILLTKLIQQELSYDQFYQNKDRMYRVYQENVINGRERVSITNSGMLAPTLKAGFPEVEESGNGHRVGSAVVEIGDNTFIENSFYYADNGFLEIFELNFLSGNRADALSNPDNIAISESLATQLFGEINGAVGKTVKVNDKDLIVTGVYEDMPKNMHMVQKKAFISNKAMGQFSWNRVGHLVYIRLREGTDLEAFQARFPQLVRDNILPILPEDSKVQIKLIPVTEIWLSDNPYQAGGGSWQAIRSYILIATFMILIATINYINLTTAKSMRRAKEIGMRKVVGASRFNLIAQFLLESVVLSLASVLIGGFMAEIFTKLFNNLSGKSIEIGFLQNPQMVLLLILFGVVLGIFSGLYPAVYLSRFKANRILKNSGAGSKGGSTLRRVLVSFQFIISIGLMISTLVVYKQINYLHTKDLGYDSEQVLSVRLAAPDTSGIMKGEILKIPSVSAVSAVNLQPATGDSGATFAITDEAGETHNDIVSMATIDYDYLDLMGIDLLKGRNFDPDFGNEVSKIIVNQTFVEKYGWEDPLGKQIEIGEWEEGEEHVFTIVGVTEDFNMLSLYEEVKPFAFFLSPQFNWGPQYLMVKVASENYQETLSQIQTAYESVEKTRPYGGIFLDDYFELIYAQENQKAKIYLTFSALTILVACIGLFGLATFILQSRMKEISIRKVLGAKMNDIVGLVSKEFLLIIILSSLIATPLAYYYSQDWLNSFAYRTNFGVDIFIASVLITLLIAMASISIQALKTARTNPAETLRDQ